MTRNQEMAEHTGANLLPIVCFSHLGWEPGLFQRPQQIMSRLAKLGHPVYFFACVGYQQHTKNPIAGSVDGAPGVKVYTLPFAPGVKKLAGIRRWMAGLKVASILAKEHVQRPVLWFYHPALFSLGYSHADSAIVYDVMDHFSSFEESSEDFYFDELGLLAESDVIFTGGRSLDRHTREMINTLVESPEGIAPGVPVHCFPSGVDLDHFRKALSRKALPGDLKGPIFGYFGAIDERIDWELVFALAHATSGNVVLHGPVLRSPRDDLPANVHLAGPVNYDRLPDVLATFDVCLIPFRNTPLVQYVSPTKTPEYLAGGKPVVSTAIPDIITDFGNVVRITGDVPSFVSACLDLVQNPPAPEQLATEAAKRASTWDQIVDQMDAALGNIITQAQAG